MYEEKQTCEGIGHTKLCQWIYSIGAPLCRRSFTSKFRRRMNLCALTIASSRRLSRSFSGAPTRLDVSPMLRGLTWGQSSLPPTTVTRSETWQRRRRRIEATLERKKERTSDDEQRIFRWCCSSDSFHWKTDSVTADFEGKRTTLAWERNDGDYFDLYALQWVEERSRNNYANDNVAKKKKVELFLDSGGGGGWSAPWRICQG